MVQEEISNNLAPIVVIGAVGGKIRHVFEGFFAAAGCWLEDYVTLASVEPLARYFYLDGTRLDIIRGFFF